VSTKLATSLTKFQDIQIVRGSVQSERKHAKASSCNINTNRTVNGLHKTVTLAAAKAFLHQRTTTTKQTNNTQKRKGPTTTTTTTTTKVLRKTTRVL
jgi:hypothetical protein